MSARSRLWLTVAILAALVLGALVWSAPSLLASYGFSRVRATMASGQPAPARLVADLAWLQRAGETATLRTLLRKLADGDREDRLAALAIASCWGAIQSGQAQAAVVQGIPIWPALQAAAPEIGRALDSEDSELRVQAIMAAQALPDATQLLPRLRELAADSSDAAVQGQAAQCLDGLQTR